MTAATTAALLALALGSAQAQTATLQGWAQLPAATFSPGPTSGQFGFSNPNSPANNPPYVNLQPVQGFSAVLAGPSAGSYLVMSDNGFGAQNNSADVLLRMYAVRPDFRTAVGGSGIVAAAEYATGAALPEFSAASHITLADTGNLLSLKVQADYARYYNSAANPLVDPGIRSGRLLTGADFDIESVRKDKNGNLWFGDEFGPYLLKTSASGEVLRREIALPGVFAPQNPAVVNGNVTANLGSSRGFEGMAINPAGDRLFTLLEGSVAGDPAGSLRINAFDVDTERYTGQQWLYKLDAAGTAIGDMTAINDHEFIVIERNGATATAGGAPFKKLYRIDLNVLDGGFVKKTELVDLMNIADPNDLNGDGSTSFTFPYVTIEDVLIVDPSTLLVINDNNFPGGGGRALASDNTEFLLIHLANPVPEPGTWALMLGGLAAVAVRRRR